MALLCYTVFMIADKRPSKNRKEMQAYVYIQ